MGNERGEKNNKFSIFEMPVYALFVVAFTFRQIAKEFWKNVNELPRWRRYVIKALLAVQLGIVPVALAIGNCSGEQQEKHNADKPAVEMKVKKPKSNPPVPKRFSWESQVSNLRWKMPLKQRIQPPKTKVPLRIKRS